MYKLNDKLRSFASLVFVVNNDVVFKEGEDDEEGLDCGIGFASFGRVRVIAEEGFHRVKCKQPSGRVDSIKVPCANEVVCDLCGDGVTLTDVRFNRAETDDFCQTLERCLTSRFKRGLNDND